MNDFTKEELMLLVYSINTYMMLDGYKRDEGLLLLKKLRIMADNYCEDEAPTQGICYRCGDGVYRNE